jgi:hypothetical protein
VDKVDRELEGLKVKVLLQLPFRLVRLNGDEFIFTKQKDCTGLKHYKTIQTASFSGQKQNSCSWLPDETGLQSACPKKLVKSTNSFTKVRLKDSQP